MTEGVFAYETEIADGEKCACVTGLVRKRRHVEIPAELGGLPVRRIAPHALSRQEALKTVSFPKCLRSVGAFALQHCPQLVQVSLYDGIRDFHNGVLRQDPQLKRIRLLITEGSYSVMRDILSDTDVRLQFCLEMPEKEARLLFPGYNYSFAENTMARTIQFSIRGSGMEYRDCVRRKEVGWWGYDRLFDRVIHEDPHAAVEIAADRLMYPVELADVHAKAYEDYLRGHASEALLLFVRELEADTEGIFAPEALARLRMMSDRGLFAAQDAGEALRLASDAGLTEACSVILDGRKNRDQAVDSGTFSLDDW
ncbi:MAG: hypothetical protein E7237_01290 [Sarcina sp.]|nr:hypothetical protein [Sarcina sp.]